MADGDNNTQSMEDLFGPVIYSYTRAQAIEDGVLVDLSELAPDVCRQHYKYHIACTAAVWAIIDQAVNNKRCMNDLKGVIHDMLWMSRVYKKNLSPSDILFQVKIVGAGRKSLFEFKMTCSGGDDGEPVLTILMPNED